MGVCRRRQGHDVAVGAVADCGKTMLAYLKSYGPHIRDNRTRLHRKTERDGRDEAGIQSAYVAPFSHVSRFTRHDLWRWRTFSASC